MVLKNILSTLVILFIVFSCKEDDSVTCTTCNSPQTNAFEVCRESNGNASVNGESTGISYDLYIDDLVAAGTTCGN